MSETSDMDIMVRARDLHRIYHLEGEDIHAVNGVSVDIPKGQMSAVVGRSGAGKTTLINLLSGLDQPTQGEVWIEDQNLFALDEAKRIALRRDNIGFVFQNFGLLPLLSAAENVSIPLRMRRMNRQEREQRIAEALNWVGLTRRAGHRPYELSGGEQQRVAIARALAARPRLIFADEPTGQLDSHTGQQILAAMRRLVDEQGITMVLVTHDPQAMRVADMVFELHDGQLVDVKDRTQMAERQKR